MRMVGGLVQKLELKLRKQLFVRRRDITVSRDTEGLERLGSQYGGWWLDKAMLGGVGPSDYVISCGAGEDITFDLEVQRRTGCTVIIVDPTPRAIQHFTQLRDAAATRGTIPINNGPHRYDTQGVNFARLVFEPLAVWNREGMLKLWVPPDPRHVSLSVINYEHSRKFIEVPATTVAALSAKYAMARIAVVKLDVENAEIAVVNDILNRGLRPQQLAVEVDELNFPNRGTMVNLRTMIGKLTDCGYVARHFDGDANFLFTRPQ
jgi:FkbM family methyltransferase